MKDGWVGRGGRTGEEPSSVVVGGRRVSFSESVVGSKTRMCVRCRFRNALDSRGDTLRLVSRGQEGRGLPMGPVRCDKE